MRAFRPVTWRERLVCLFFPARCLTCGKAVRAQRLVCRACAASLPQKPFFQEFPLPRAQEGRLAVVAPLSYEKGTRRTLRRLKFQEERALAKPLAALMAQAVGQWGREFDGVVWVPMSPKKLQQRGYNQSQLLAKSLAKELHLPCWDLLEQVRETATQHELSRAERADNVRGAYRARPAARGKDLLLVDDIVTTGATLRACALALYEAGARQVCGLCAAGTAWEPGREEEEIPQGEP